MECTIPYADGQKLSVKKHLVHYVQDGFTFQYYATYIAPVSQDGSQQPPDSLTLVACHALGLRMFICFSMTSFVL